MERFLLAFVLIVVVAGHKHHPKFPKGLEEVSMPLIRKVACTADKGIERDKIIEKSKCGEPKEVFEYLKLKAAHEQVSPSAVWVKRCVGLCEFDNGGSCVASETVIRHIPVRIFNEKTQKETCAMYPVEEHVSCMCCALTAEGCGAPRVFNPQKPEYEVESI